MNPATRYLLPALVLFLCIPDSDAAERQALFKIERNKNANIVQYDAQIEVDGRLAKRDPVVAYWVRLAEQGQVEELTWTQNAFAYGISSSLNRERNRAEVELKANIGRSFTVSDEGDGYRAQMVIDGKASWIDRIFIHSTGKGLSTKVNYIDLFGHAVDGSGERQERIVP